MVEEQTKGRRVAAAKPSRAPSTADEVVGDTRAQGFNAKRPPPQPPAQIGQEPELRPDGRPGVPKAGNDRDERVEM
jgi:hypothetical protein